MKKAQHDMTNLSYPPALLNKEEAAAYLAKISPRTLDKLQAQGHITPHALGARRVYKRAELDKFAESLPEWETK